LQIKNFLTSVLLLDETSFRRKESLLLCKYSFVGIAFKTGQFSCNARSKCVQK